MTNSKTAIDNFLTNIEKYKTTIEGAITFLSDHDAQILTLNTITKKVWDNKPLKQYMYRQT